MTHRWPLVGATAALVACAQGQSSSPDAMADAPADAAVDAPRADARPGGPNDTCAGAEDLTAAAHQPGGAMVSADLTGYLNDVQPPMACTGFVNDGPDATYQVTMAAGETLTATLSPQGWDAALEIVQPCVLNPICLGGSDGANPEVASYTATAPITVYVVVDSWSDTAFGPYQLHVQVD
ncbi:MAG: hypothetical protein R3B06_18350 [Kofleriaceae bacterium]